MRVLSLTSRRISEIKCMRLGVHLRNMCFRLAKHISFCVLNSETVMFFSNLGFIFTTLFAIIQSSLCFITCEIMCLSLNHSCDNMVLHDKLNLNYFQNQEV